MTKKWAISPDHVWALVLLVVASAIVLANLGNCYMPGDEAQTALISRTILTHGIPLGYDGKNYFAVESGQECGKDYVWRWHPWLPFYVLAGFFALFGQSTFVCRLPFALFGIATVVLVYYFGLSMWRSRRIGVLAAVTLMTCVPFLILVRQCRYYSMATFFFIAGLYAYHQMLQGRRYATTAFLVSGLLLFHSLYIYLPALLCTAIVHSAIYHRKHLKRVILLSVGLVVVNVPWIIFFASVVTVYHGQRNVLHAMWVQLRSFPIMMVKHVFLHPAVLIPLLILAGVALVVRKLRLRDVVQPEKLVLALLAIGMTLLAFLPTSALPYFRYLAPIIPLACLLAAVILDAAMKLHPAIGIAAILASAILGNARGYIYEITHDFSGPVEGITAYLNAHGRPGDVVAVNHEPLPLMFYTNLRVINGNAGEDLSPMKTARWAIVRQYASEVEAQVFRYMGKSIPWGDYEEITLDAPDTGNENSEDPEKHYFETQLEAPVVIYKRIR